MRDGWRLEILGEISDVIMGRQLSPSKKIGTRPRPYIRAANIGSWGISLNEIFEMDFTEDEEARFASRIGDTLLVEGGNEKSVGCPGLVTENEAGLCIQNTVIRCRVKNPEVFNPEFQYQVLRYMYWRRDFAELCAGTTIMHLGQKRAELVQILLPPPPEQKRIVDLISSVDCYVEALQQQFESAKRSRNAVLHELLTAGGDDWVETTLGEISKCAGGCAFPDAFQGNKEGIPFIKVSDMNSQNNERYIETSNNSVSAEVVDELRLRIWDKGTVIFPKVGAALLTEKRRILTRKTIFDNNIMGLVPNERVLSDFLFLLMLQIRFSDHVQPGAVPSIKNSIVEAISVLLPPLDEQKRIVTIVSELDSYIHRTETSMNGTKVLRSALLSQLLSGEHEIPSSYDKVMGAA